MLCIAVDFDGTLVEDEFPKIGAKRQTVINAVRELQRLGAKTILWTCRNGDALDKAVQWCKEHDLLFDAVNENLPEVQEKWGGDTRKVLADVYIDDKNVGGLYHYQLWDLVYRLSKEKSGE